MCDDNRHQPDILFFGGNCSPFLAEYCKFGNFREDFIFAKLRICEVSSK